MYSTLALSLFLLFFGVALTLLAGPGAGTLVAALCAVSLATETLPSWWRARHGKKCKK